jgi:hypothetical protein
MSHKVSSAIVFPQGKNVKSLYLWGHNPYIGTQDGSVISFEDYFTAEDIEHGHLVWKMIYDFNT